MFDYISTAKNCTSIPISQGFYTIYERLCTSLKTHCISTKNNSKNSINKLLLLQCIAKSCKMISLLGYCYIEGKITIPNDIQMKRLISILHILSNCIINIKRMYSEESYAVIMLFWTACDAMSCMKDIVKKSQGENYNDNHHNNNNNNNNNNYHKNNNNNNNKRGNYNYNNSSHSKTMDQSIFQSLISTCPSPQDLEDELLRLQYQRLMDENKPILAGSSETDKGSSTSTRNDFTNEFQCLFSCYRLQYIIEGLQRALRAGVLTIGRRYDKISYVMIYCCMTS